MLKRIFLVFGMFVFVCNAWAEYVDDVFVEEIEDVEEVEDADKTSSSALENYQVDGSLFERITNLEQEKIIVQLETERAKMDLDLEKLNAERSKIQNTAESKQLEIKIQELEAEKEQMAQMRQEMEQQIAQVRQQVENIRENQNIDGAEVVTPKPAEQYSVANKYQILNIIGVGNQVQATIKDLSSGQNRRIAVGNFIDGHRIKSISLNEGIVFEKDGFSENLNIRK